jgi:hypothetical protein
MMSADGARRGGGQSASQEMALLMKSVEMNMSNFGDRHSKKTRQGYKDDMKRRIFEEIEEAANALQVHEWVVTRAQTLFGQVRDETENLRDKQGCAAACMIFALREAAKEDHGGRKRAHKQASSSSSSASGGAAAAAGGGSDRDINPFKCKKCGIGFGDRKSVRYHEKECDEGGAGAAPAAGT